MHEAWKRPATAAEVACASRDPESFGRCLRDWQHELRRLSSRKAFRERIRDAPPLTAGRLGDLGQSDAYLAAYVDWLCARHGVEAPAWVDEPARVARKAWYDYPPLWQDAFLHAPAAFRRRAVFTRPDDPLRFRRGRPKLSEAHKRERASLRQRSYRERIRAKLDKLEGSTQQVERSS